MEGKHPAMVGAEASQAQVAGDEFALTGRSAWPAGDLGRARDDRVFQHAPMGILEVDAEGRLLRVNPAFSRMTGYPSEELVGRSIADIADRDGGAELIERLYDLLRRGDGVDRFDVGYTRRDGARLQGRVTASVLPARPGRSASLIALVEDASADDAPMLAESRVDAVEMVADSIAEARATAYEKGIDIAYAYATAPVWVHADEVQLRQAIDELLAATLRSTPLGTVAVRCTARDGDALLEVMEVRDPDAAGADLGALFDENQQAEPGEARRVRQRSLGSMQELARAQHGKVEMTTSAASGSHITVRLPLARG